MLKCSVIFCPKRKKKWSSTKSFSEKSIQTFTEWVKHSVQLWLVKWGHSLEPRSRPAFIYCTCLNSCEELMIPLSELLWKKHLHFIHLWMTALAVNSECKCNCPSSSYNYIMSISFVKTLVMGLDVNSGDYVSDCMTGSKTSSFKINTCNQFGTAELCDVKDTASWFMRIPRTDWDSANMTRHCVILDPIISNNPKISKLWKRSEASQLGLCWPAGISCYSSSAL